MNNQELDQFIITELNEKINDNVKYINIKDKDENKNGSSYQYIIDGVIDALHYLLKNLPIIAKETDSKAKISKYVYSRTGKQLGVDEMSLLELDKIAHSYINTTSYISTAEGLLGVAGFMLSPIELPLFLTINCRMLVQLCWIYGIEPTEDFILELMCGAIKYEIADNEYNRQYYKRINEQIEDTIYEKGQNVDKMGLREGEYDFLAAGIYSTTVKRLVKNSVYKLIAYITNERILSIIPVVGGAMSISSNYYFSRNTGLKAMRRIKKKWILNKYGDEYFKSKDKLMEKKLKAEWVLVN